MMSIGSAVMLLLWLLSDHSGVRQRVKGTELMTDETSTDREIAKANLAEHLKNIDIACDDARLSSVEKIRRIKEEIEKAQDCLERLSLK
jgi:hypothetical protein